MTRLPGNETRDRGVFVLDCFDSMLLRRWEAEQARLSCASGGGQGGGRWGKTDFGQHRIVGAAAAIGIAGLVAACSSGSPNPAPVILRGDSPGAVGGGFAGGFTGGFARGAAYASAPARPMPVATRNIVVQRGQSLGFIALAYHVPTRAIIAANHLTPPYKIETGQHLMIPGGGEPMRPMLAARAPEAPEAPIAGRHSTPDIIPLDGPAPAPWPPIRLPGRRARRA